MQITLNKINEIAKNIHDSLTVGNEIALFKYHYSDQERFLTMPKCEDYAHIFESEYTDLIKIYKKGDKLEWIVYDLLEYNEFEVMQ